MRPTRRRLVVLLAGGAGLLVSGALGAALALPFVLDMPRVQDLLRSEASRLLDRPVRFERVALSLWPLPAVRIRRLTVANGASPDPLLGVEEVRVRVRILPLLTGRLQFGEVTLERPRVVLEQRRDGGWNLSSPGGARPAPGGSRSAPAAPFVLVSRVRLVDGQVEVRIPGESGRPAVVHRLDRIDVTLDDLGWSRPIGLRAAARLPGGGIAVTLDGTIGPLVQAGTDLSAVPVQIEARFTAAEARLPLGEALGVAGKTGDGAIRLAGRLGSLAGSGRLRFARLVLTHRPVNCPAGAVRTLVLDGVDLPIEIEGLKLTARPFVVRVAGGTVQGEATVTWRAGVPGVRLAAVRIQGVSAEPVLVDFLCQPYAVTGRADGSGEVTFTGFGDEMRRSAKGTWEVKLGAGRLVGPAVLKLLAGAVRVGAVVNSMVNLDVSSTLLGSPVEFRSLAAAGTLGGGQARVRELTMVSPGLTITGDGTYGLVDGRLDFNINARSGRSTFAVKIGGTGPDPSYEAGRSVTLKGISDALAPLISRFRRPSRSSSPPPASP